MHKSLLTYLLILLGLTVEAQQNIKKGSYAAYGELTLEDNSFLLEEAFNQQMGSIQYISTFGLSNINYKSLQYTFTQEIPITDQLHQFSYSFNYNINAKNYNEVFSNGFGDLTLSYRYQVFDFSDYIMLIPRISLILPTGNAANGLGTGSFGIQLGVAATKRLSNKFIVHGNVGATEYLGYDHFTSVNHLPFRVCQRNLLFHYSGTSVVWHMKDRINLLFETMSSYGKEITDEGKVIVTNTHCINPGMRFSFIVNNMQVVPGLCLPINIIQEEIGMMFYLSFEPNYFQVK